MGGTVDRPDADTHRDMRETPTDGADLRARLHHEAEAGHAEQLLHFAGTLGAVATTDELADVLTQFLSTAFRARALVVVAIEDSLRVVAVRGYSGDVSDWWLDRSIPLTAKTPLARSIAESRTIELGSIDEFAAYPDLEAVRHEFADASLVVAPLYGSARRKEAVGAVRISWPHPNRLDEAAWTLLQTVISMVELALSRIELIDEETRRLAERERFAVEVLQRAALPTQLPQLRGVELDAVYQAAAATAGIGGDWYDAFSLGGDRVALVIADVAGHGQEAATYMVQIRNVLRALAAEHDQPHVVLERANAIAHLLGGIEAPFITCCYAVLDVSTRTLAWAKAGHFDPLIVTTDGDAEYAASPVRPPLSVLPDPGYVTTRRQLQPGDRVLLLTDGLIERREESIDVGLARLAERAASARRLASRECLVELLSLVDTQFDDIALLCVDLAG
jgi:serine phosphatase RsbU (regulator of sigma subunit)